MAQAAPSPIILRSKIVIVGECKVGKTALTSVFHQGSSYPKQYIKTLGVDLLVSQVKIPESETTVELYMLDVSGDDIYKKIRSQYMEGGNYLMACYDISNAASFQKCKEWIEEAKKVMVKGNQKLQGVIVACKCDLRDFAQVRTESALELAHEHGFGFFETSSAMSIDTDTPFNFIANSYYLMYEKHCEDSSEL